MIFSPHKYKQEEYMTKRLNDFTAAQQAVPLSAKFTEKAQLETNNPLTAFFRKSKFSLKLPSRGKWYPENSLTLDEHGGLAVFAMTAADDIRFRAGDIAMNGQNIYDIVASCIPGIKIPTAIPHIDMDAIMLAIRCASYGFVFDFTVSVPKTTLVRQISIDALDLLRQAIESQNIWDDELVIADEYQNKLVVGIRPISMQELFTTSKNMLAQRRILSRNVNADESIQDEKVFADGIASITNNAIDLICHSIYTLQVQDATGKVQTTLTTDVPQDAQEIASTIKNLDVAYFNSIRKHIDDQRAKYSFFSNLIKSTPEEIIAGAPEEWRAELNFITSDFLPDLGNVPGVI